jgi:DNA-binding NarL/FixJ family response regulator
MPEPSHGSPGQPAIRSCSPAAAVGSPPPTYTVAIVNDQPITRGGLEQLVALIPGLTVAASVTSVDQLDLSGGYDAVVIDVPMRDDGLTLKTITRMAEISRPLVVLSWDRPPSLLAMVRAGACGCVTRRSSHRTVAAALSVVAAGGFYLCEQLVPHLRVELNRPPRADPYGLAPREVETLQWIARGLTHTQIATRMGLSQATVNTYAKRIRAKLKVNNKADLTRIAIELGHLGEAGHDHIAA